MATIQIEVTDKNKIAFLTELIQTFQADLLTIKAIDGEEVSKEESNTLLHEEKINQEKKWLYKNNFLYGRKVLFLSFQL